MPPLPFVSQAGCWFVAVIVVVAVVVGVAAVLVSTGEVRAWREGVRVLCTVCVHACVHTTRAPGCVIGRTRVLGRSRGLRMEHTQIHRHRHRHTHTLTHSHTHTYTHTHRRVGEQGCKILRAPSRKTTHTHTQTGAHISFTITNLCQSRPANALCSTPT
jgi:hypothetical protein